MGDEGDYWRDVKVAERKRKDRNLAAAQSSPQSWTKHTDYHWSMTLAGKRLDYWPSRNKFQYEGRVMTGNVEQFIFKRAGGDQPEIK